MTFTIHLPQVIFIALMTAGTVLHCARHGQPKNDKYHAGYAVFSDVIIYALLYWGGFFSVQSS